ncbi:MAG TPA: BadF/BadG/BcrA/BcrD ATPase family protein [Solirubrobacteraceae bacterium]|nr:BadF/BadG/BcrA/BcrD ATPase family protein [Solirubrobacteraceae bacterium]
MTATGTDGSDGADLVLAVDGGNTKTDLALLDSSGRLLSLARGGGSSAHYLGAEGCAAVLEGLLKAAFADAGLSSSSRPLAATAQILVAGADLPEERSALRAEIEKLDWSGRLVIDNDTPALLRAGTDRGWGICVVCGAGINCLGVGPDRREARFLALGEISGDWGGGVGVGLAALTAAARSADGRGPRTLLEGAVPAQFGLTDALELSRAVHLQQIPETRLGELAPIVLALCDEDPVAASIVRRLAGEVSALASAAIRRLELTDADPDVVLGGRLLRSVAPSVLDTIVAAIHEVAPNARVVVSASEPIVGAALLGLDALGADPATSARGRAELDAAVAAFGVEQQPATA